MLCLPRNLHMEAHKVLHLPRHLHMEVHKALHLPRILHMEVHKVLRLPRNLHMEVHKSVAPATKSAHAGSQSAVPATKSALQDTSETSNPNGRTIPTMPENDPRPSRTRRSADLDLPASEPPVPLKNTAFRALAISPQRILYCACHDICTWRRTKCCACHEICTWRFTKCCTCHEICTWRFTKCCTCHAICTWSWSCLELELLKPELVYERCMMSGV